MEQEVLGHFGRIPHKATFRVEVEHENGIVLDLNHDSLSSK